MPDKNEKERRKQILDDIRRKETEEFEKNLPCSRELFKNLFDYLDKKLGEVECDDTLSLTEKFLIANGISELSPVNDWLHENGAYCDCEVLANIEEKFE